MTMTRDKVEGTITMSFFEWWDWFFMCIPCVLIFILIILDITSDKWIGDGLVPFIWKNFQGLCRHVVSPLAYLCGYIQRWENNLGIGFFKIGSIPVSDEGLQFMNQVKEIFYSENRLCDVTLISADLMEHGAHKFILSARSSVFKKIIETEMKRDDYKDKIILGNINGKPLVALPHWIYSGELHENTGKCMAELVKAAKAYDMPNLMKVVDKKLITLCKKENIGEVFHFYEVAKEYSLRKAKKEIAKFIKN